MQGVMVLLIVIRPSVRKPIALYVQGSPPHNLFLRYCSYGQAALLSCATDILCGDIGKRYFATVPAVGCLYLFALCAHAHEVRGKAFLALDMLVSCVASPFGIFPRQHHAA